MAGFAPSYYHESNNAWLNDLVADIIEPLAERVRGDRHADHAATEVPDIESEYRSASQQSVPQWRQSIPTRSSRRTSPASRTSAQSPAYNAAVHYSYRSALSRTSQASATDMMHRSASARDTPFETIAEGDGLVSLDPFHPRSSTGRLSAELNQYSSMSRDTSRSQRRLLRDSTASISTDSSSLWHDHEKLPSTRAGSVPSRTDRETAWNDEFNDAAFREHDMPSRNTQESRTSLGRTRSQKRLSDLLQKPPLARIHSDVSQSAAEIEAFKGFAPHPAVRVFNEREKLGEAAGPDGDDDHEYPGKFALTLIVIGVCLSVFIISVDRSIVTTAIPKITETFHSYDDIGWYGSSYFLTASAFQPLYGRIYITFDTRWTFLAALAIFELGSLLGAVSPSSSVLILGRAVQGFGSAGILTGSFVVGTHSVPLRGRPILFAFVGILYGVGSLAGPLLGGVFTDFLTWRWVFWINLPIGAVTFVSVMFFFKPRKDKKVDSRPSWINRILQLDLIGNAILLGASVMLFLALQISETSGTWSNAPVIGLLCGFGVATIMFVSWLLYRGDKALIPPRILRQRTVASSCGLAFFLYGGLLLHAYYLPIWFQAIKGDSAVHSGVNMIPYMLANALFSMIAGIFVSRNGLFAPPAIIGTAIGTVGCGMLYTLTPSTSTGMWIGYEILISAGLGLAIQQGFSAVQTALPLEEVPIGTAAVVASQSLGGSLFVSIGNTILQDHLLNKNADNAIPGVDVRVVFEMGATAFRSFVPEDKLPALVALYNDSLQYVFLAAVPLIGCSFLCALCMEWKSVKSKQELTRKKDQEDVAEKA